MTAAIVLTGGTGRRLGGVDKATLELDGVRLIDHALAAVDGSAEIVVVGPEVGGVAGVRFVREQPAYGGPAAGLAAGLAATVGDPVMVLAVDLPRVTRATVARLLQAARDHDGAVLVDATGRRQLALVVARAPLAATLPDDAGGLPLWRVVEPLDLAEVPAHADEARDVDTWADLES